MNSPLPPDGDDAGHPRQLPAVLTEMLTLVSRLTPAGPSALYLGRRQLPGAEPEPCRVGLLMGSTVTDAERQASLGRASHAAGLRHKSVSSILDLGTVGGGVFVAEAYVASVDLGSVLRAQVAAGVPLAQGAAISIVAGVAAALVAAEQSPAPGGIVHGHLDPLHVLVGEGGHVLVSGFGLPPVPATSWSYCAPERLAGGPTDLRADVFAAGVMLYELLTASPFYEGLPAEQVPAVARAGGHLPSRWGTLGEALQRILVLSLHPDVTRRYASAEVFRDDLNDVARSLGVEPGAAAVAASLAGLVPQTERPDASAFEPFGDLHPDEAARSFDEATATQEAPIIPLSVVGLTEQQPEPSEHPSTDPAGGPLTNFEVAASPDPVTAMQSMPSATVSSNEFFSPTDTFQTEGEETREGSTDSNPSTDEGVLQVGPHDQQATLLPHEMDAQVFEPDTVEVKALLHSDLSDPTMQAEEPWPSNSGEDPWTANSSSPPVSVLAFPDDKPAAAVPRPAMNPRPAAQRMVGAAPPSSSPAAAEATTVVPRAPRGPAIVAPLPSTGPSERLLIGAGLLAAILAVTAVAIYIVKNSQPTSPSPSPVPTVVSDPVDRSPVAPEPPSPAPAVLDAGRVAAASGEEQPTAPVTDPVDAGGPAPAVEEPPPVVEPPPDERPERSRRARRKKRSRDRGKPRLPKFADLDAQLKHLLSRCEGQRCTAEFKKYRPGQVLTLPEIRKRQVQTAADKCLARCVAAAD